jgi:hypothetical protein
VASNPEPHNSGAIQDTDRTIAHPNPGRIDLISTFQLLKLETRMTGIRLEQAISSSGIFLNVVGKSRKLLPKKRA